MNENAGMKLNDKGGIDIDIAAEKRNGAPKENGLPFHQGKAGHEADIDRRGRWPVQEDAEQYQALPGFALELFAVRTATGSVFSMLRLYGPLEPWLEQAWRLGEDELRKILLVLVCFIANAGCAGVDTKGIPAHVSEIQPGILAGYLRPEALPSSLALIPPPPAEGSAGLAYDDEVSRKGLALRDTSRWKLAIEDADLKFPDAAETFSCALGIPITEQGTPHLYMLLRRTLTDAGLSTYTAKKHYQRARPFMGNGGPICTPEEAAGLRRDGSYPSGHTAIGWAWALILTEIAPGRADLILARGRAFGESRNICNVHWHSDVAEGRFMGAATVARLHADPVFSAELRAAKAEYEAAFAKGLAPSRDCESEASTLAIRLHSFDGEAEILRSWHGDFPTNQLHRLPELQRQLAVGFVDSTRNFENVWKAFKPGEAVPDIDFAANMVLFARNTQFYNSIRIGKVNVTSGVAEVLAMETMSAKPIEDTVAMSLVVVPRRGISGIQAGVGVIPIKVQR